jgi:methionine biosynthesis protein MetW
MKSEPEQLDHRIIAQLIEPHSTVLDLGCGTGELLYFLIGEKGVRGQGIEIDESAIYQCVARGLNVLHGDLDSGLSEYLDRSFDYVILNQCLQQVRHVETVFIDSLRVGKKVIVGFPNFAHFRARLQLGLKGRAPVTASLPYAWFDTPNLHFLSIADFYDYCREKGVRIERSEFLGRKGPVRILPNLFAETAIFLLSGKGV